MRVRCYRAVLARSEDDCQSKTRFSQLAGPHSPRLACRLRSGSKPSTVRLNAGMGPAATCRAKPLLAFTAELEATHCLAGFFHTWRHRRPHADPGESGLPAMRKHTSTCSCVYCSSLPASPAGLFVLFDAPNLPVGLSAASCILLRPCWLSPVQESGVSAQNAPVSSDPASSIAMSCQLMTSWPISCRSAT